MPAEMRQLKDAKLRDQKGSYYRNRICDIGAREEWGSVWRGNNWFSLFQEHQASVLKGSNRMFDEPGSFLISFTIGERTITTKEG